MDTLIKFLPKSFSVDQSPTTGEEIVQMVCECIGPVDTNFHKLLHDVSIGNKHIVILDDMEYITLSTDSKKLNLILLEILELKELIKNNRE